LSGGDWLSNIVHNAPNDDVPRCELCGEPIPIKVIDAGESRGTEAKYHSAKCRRRAKFERYAQKVVANLPATRKKDE
jgi:hypothetical protein